MADLKSETFDKFRAWIPIDKIEKSKDSDGNEIMKFAGYASPAGVEDTDGETLSPENFDISYLKNRGIINWSHAKKGLESAIGEPTKAEIRKGGLWLESLLYPDNPEAVKVYQLGKILQKNSKTRRLGYSIEGRALARDSEDPTKVTKAMITNCAICLNPKNIKSVIDIIKGNFDPTDFEEDTIDVNENNVDQLIKSYSTPDKSNIIDITREDGMRVIVNDDYEVKIEKALSAGEITGRDTTNSTTDSGAPLKLESVDGVKTSLSKKKKKKSQDDDEQEEADGGEEFLAKSVVFEKIFQTLPGIGFEKAEKIFSALNNLTMKSDNKTKITDDLLEKALANLKLKKGDDGASNDEEDDSDDVEEGVKDELKKGKKKEEIKKAAKAKKLDDEADKEDDEDEDDAEETKETEKEELKKAAKAKKLDDEADKEDDEDEDDEEETETTEKEELKKAAKSKKLDDEADKEDDKDEDDEEEQDDEVDDDEEDDEENDGDDTDAKDDVEKALRDTSHLILKTVTGKDGKTYRKWTDPKKGEGHHDIKPGSKVKYEHKGKEHVGEMKFVAKNGQYVVDNKKHGVIGKHPHQVKKHVEVAKPKMETMEKAISSDIIGESMFNNIEKSLDVLNDAIGSKFNSFGIVLKGMYDLQKGTNAEVVGLKNDLTKSLTKIAELEDLIEKGNATIEEMADTAPVKKSVTTSTKARQREFIQGEEMKKGLETTEDDNTGGITLSISKNKNKILAYLDTMTFEKGLDNQLAGDMTLFESSSTLNDYAFSKLKARGIKLVK
jgi:hypothetical protein